MVSQTRTVRVFSTTCSLVTTSPSLLTMKPDPLLSPAMICTTLARMLSMTSASDDLLLSDRSAAPTNWILRAGSSDGVGVSVSDDTGVILAVDVGVSTGANWYPRT